ncbi:hypothetical protein [Mesoflavibacter sp. SCSIO 43206]|uniref:hypothetical protein n=1 Tax=Mesoflavibacter sp. SCSIO 43206 TaxID=2779362 RepID=UPI001CA8ECBC|nr:hypothetical protein [Mesoflavibacter sp. SCSIO 43206]UAB75397.1 hypothetical protein INR78_13565 [Mesoflavibacter sp. SCSIO 43206]
MKLNKYKTVTFVLVILVVISLFGNLFQNNILSEIAWVLILPTLIYFYSIKKKHKNVFFTVFLIGFAISEFFKMWIFTSELFNHYISYVFIMTAYCSLITFFLKGMDAKRLIKKFKFHIFILITFNLYILYTLNQMILQDDSLEVFTFLFFLEVFYNLLILSILSMSLLYYLYTETKQALLLFLACVCIVFSEMIQVAYYFITEEIFLKIGYIVLMAIGFSFIYFYILLDIKSKSLIKQ